MRVLFLNYEYPPLGGGAGNAAFYLLREFAKISDLEVDFVTSSPDSHFHLEQAGENIFVHKMPIGKNSCNLHFQSQKDLLTYTVKAYFYSRRLAKKNKYDLSHSFFSVPCGFLSLIFKKFYGIPYIVSLRGADVPGYTDRFCWMYKAIRPLIRFIWKQADFVIANSEGLKTLALKTNLKQQISVIMNGVDINQFYFKNNRQITSQRLEILCLSRLTERKGINYLVAAMPILRKKYPQVHLKIVGEGDAAQSLRQMVTTLKLEDRVEFLGHVAHDNLPQIYAQADIFVLPSLNEGMSNTILEALSAGLPIITTDTGGTKELVKDGKNGFIIKMKDPADIAEKIEKFIQNKSLSTAMSLASRKKAERLSWENIAKEYWELYKKVNSI